MTKVFVGGSRHASRLSTEIRSRLDTIIEKGIPVVVGDANGADRAVQHYLHSKHYANVEVFCTAGLCRNNVGSWPTRKIAAATRSRDAQFHSAKDRAMASEATVGLMVWDGKSIGTLMNVFRLLRLKKKAVVYVVPEHEFLEFRSLEEWQAFLAGRSADLRQRFNERAKSEMPAPGDALQASFLD